MTTSSNPGAYKTHYALFDRAIEDPSGVRVKFPDFNSANRFRLELHSARQVDRNQNRKTYDRGHHLHAQSLYDPLRITIENEQGEVWLYVKRFTLDGLVVESLTQDEEPADV